MLYIVYLGKYNITNISTIKRNLSPKYGIYLLEPSKEKGKSLILLKLMYLYAFQPFLEKIRNFCPQIFLTTGLKMSYGDLLVEVSI